MGIRVRRKRDLKVGPFNELPAVAGEFPGHERMTTRTTTISTRVERMV